MNDAGRKFASVALAGAVMAGVPTATAHAEALATPSVTPEVGVVEVKKEVEVKKKEARKSQRETDARERGIDLDAIPQAIDGEKNPEEEEEIKEPYFLLICLTSVFGFLGKYLLNILISYKKNSFDEKNKFKRK